MSKINMNGGGGFFSGVKDFFANIFSSKKNIIIASIVLGVIIITAVVTTIVIHSIKKANQPKPPEKITITFNIYLDEVKEENLFSGVEIYDNSTHTQIYKAPSGEFSVNSIDNGFTKGVNLKVQKEGYLFHLNSDNTSDIYEYDGYVFVKTDKDKTVTVIAEKEVSEKEELLKRSIKINFYDRNGTPITSTIKVIDKDSLVIDPMTNEPDYESSWGVNATDGSIIIEIDENMTSEVATTYVFYSKNYTFDELVVDSSDRGTEANITGTVKEEVTQTISLEDLVVTLKFPNNAFVNTEVKYYYTNTYGGRITPIAKMAQTGTNITFDENTMFDHVYFTVKTDEKFYYAYVFPTTESHRVIEVKLIEGKIIQAKAGYNINITIIDNTNDAQTIITSDGDKGLIEFVTADGNITFMDNNNNELYLVRLNKSETQILENITFNGENIIYNENSYNINLLRVKKPENE